MEILSREFLMNFRSEKVKQLCYWDIKVVDSLLALMDERDKMKAGIEKLIDKIENKVTREDEILQDLASIGGKGEK